MELILNDGQNKAASAFFEFLFSNDKEFIISGPGGTGKTRLMSYLIDETMPHYFQTCKMMAIAPEYDEVRMTATTNKAAEVLAVATKRPTDTIHSFLNLKVQDDFSTGRSKLTQSRDWMVHSKKIIFIDECSMIDKDLLDFLYKGTIDSKIVYVGDHCQLAPIMEPISPIYREELPFYELTEQMRNANQPALMNVCNQLRHTVETGEFRPIEIVPGVIDLLDDAQMQAQLDATFNQQTHESRILAYTNKRVMLYNDYIRQLRQLPDEYVTGEYLVNNSAIRLKNRMLSVEEEVTIDAQSSVIEDIMIEANVFLKVRRTTLSSAIGEMFYDIPIPVDRPHFTALLNYYRSKKNWERYFYLKNTFPDLRQRDAATVHKSQGSTYESVFIDLNDISQVRQSDQAARMLYVAFSRPRTRVFLYGDLASKYGGLKL